MPQTKTLLDFLKNRRSTTTTLLTGPGPTPAQLHDILTIGLRVPDHGKLEPWRLIVVEGAARQVLGKRLAEDFYTEKNTLTERQQEKLSNIIMYSVTDVPLMIYVVSSLNEKATNIPRDEQLLSAGAVCMNIILAANAMGYGANWISGWLAYSQRAKNTIGIKSNEQIAGVIFIGTGSNQLADRKRPDLQEKVHYWSIGEDSQP